MPALVTTCKLNQVLDAVVARLQVYVKPKVGLNLVPTPVTIKRVLRTGDFTGLAKPLLAVQANGWNADPKAARRFDGTLRFSITAMITAKEGDEVELLNLVTDVIRAMAIDVTLGGLVTYCFPVEFTPLVDVNALTGFAQAAVTFEALYNWEAETP